MMLKTSALVAACVLGAGTVASAQHQPLMFGDFETLNAADPNLPQGWAQFNGVRRRTVGDGLLPALSSAHGGVAAVEFTPAPLGPSDFIGLTSNALTDPDDAASPTNNPGYPFDPPSGPDLRFGLWYMIPASDPVVGQRVGTKYEFIRTANGSNYEVHESFFLDPAAATQPTGVVSVSTLTGPGIHTNGQWLFHEWAFSQSSFRIPLWPLPPENPNARVKMLVLRFGSDYLNGARGTLFVDDVSFSFDEPCVADFNGSGSVTVQDIFDFLAAYFSSDPNADINNSGSVTVQDIFDFLAAYFAGC